LTHDTECISEPDYEDTAHRLEDDLPLKRRLSEQEEEEEENKNMNNNNKNNNNLGGKLFRSRKGRNLRYILFRKWMPKVPTALARPHFSAWIGNLLQWLQGAAPGLQALLCKNICTPTKIRDTTNCQHRNSYPLN
jgi:hypothetical protein